MFSDDSRLHHLLHKAEDDANTSVGRFPKMVIESAQMGGLRTSGEERLRVISAIGQALRSTR